MMGTTPARRRAYVATATYTFHEGHATRLPRAVLVRGDRVEGFADPDRRHGRRQLDGIACDDLGAAVLMPGFVDAHNHQPTAARDAGAVRTAHVRSVAELLGVLAAAAARTDAGEWIATEHSLTQSQLRSPVLPTARELDRVTPNHPVAVRFGAHTMVLNTVALDRIGVRGRSSEGPGGLIERDPGSGSAVGPIREYHAIRLVLDQLTPPTREQQVDSMRSVQREYVRAGVTTVRIPGLRPGDLEVYRDLLQVDGRLAHRVFGGPRLDPNDSHADKCTTIRSWRTPGLEANPWLGLHAAKIFVDGGVETLLDGRQHFFLDTAELTDLVRRCVATEWSVACHAVTEAAIDQVLDAFESAGTLADGQCLAIEHGFFASPSQLKRAGRLGVWLSTQPAVAYLEATALHAALPASELRHSFPLAGAIRHGVRCALGSDWNATPDSSLRPFDPLRSIRMATTRIGLDGEVVGPEERIRLETAIYLHTRSPARMLAATDLGGLWQGARADLAVLDADPCAAPSEVAATGGIVGGVLVT